MKRFLGALGLALSLMALWVGAAFADLSPMEQLGKRLFFDDDLSTPAGVACAACHAPNTAFVGPVSDFNAHGAVYPGAVHTRFGNRKPPSAAYATFSPPFHFSEEDGLYEGGMFWDGRALDTVAQAKGPFLNPLEMNNPNQRSVVIKVLRSDYADLFSQVYMQWKMDTGLTVGQFPYLRMDVGDAQFVADAYQLIAESISAYEGSSEVNQFSSKYDAYLAGTATLTAQEAWGLQLFEGKAGCSGCHVSEPDAEEGTPPLFTDFTYDNLGVPKNPENPFYSMPPGFNPLGAEWVDYGLGAIIGVADELGKMKVPTLRNVGMRPSEGFVQAYMHNGVFKSLREVVDFYNTRDLGGWPPAEVPDNVNHDELGDLGLTSDEVDAIVAFMNTLTDGWTAEDAPVMTLAGATPRLLDAAPNPFQSATRLRFTLPEAGAVRLSVFDIQGRLARTLVPGGTLSAGPQAVVWDGRNDRGERVAPGVYFYRLDRSPQGNVQRIVLLP